MKKLIVFILTILVFSSIIITPCYAEEYLYLNKSQAHIEVNDTFQLLVNLNPEYIKWSSSNKSVADVSQDGTVTGIAIGQALITANCYGYELECAVTVIEAKPEEVKHISADTYVSVLPLSDRVNIKLSDHQLSETHFTISSLDKTIVSYKWGEAKDNSIPLILNANMPGYTTIYIHAKYKDGTEENIAIYVISLCDDVFVYPTI